MSRHLDNLEALLNRALPMPAESYAWCRTCNQDRVTLHDPQGSISGLNVYVCPACGDRYPLDGPMTRRPEEVPRVGRGPWTLPGLSSSQACSDPVECRDAASPE